MKINIYTHEDCLQHNPGDGHPEQPDRLNAIMAALKNSAIHDELTYIAAPLAKPDQILLAHTQDHLDLITSNAPQAGMSAIDNYALDGDTIMSVGSLNAALRGVGAACKAVDDLFSNNPATAFCATRPPGHHACANQAMGFCLFNNIAIAALYAQQHYGLKKVAIVDFDVHHGNGSQDILAGKEGVLYISTHQSPLYPGSGSTSENISGNILNIPLPASTGHSDYMAIFEAEVLPVLDTFEPELILVSAGFDAHQQDPLANLALNEETYQWLGEKLINVAHKHCQGKLLSVLEGGYNLQVIGSSLVSYLQGIQKSSEISS